MYVYFNHVSLCAFADHASSSCTAVRLPLPFAFFSTGHLYIMLFRSIYLYIYKHTYTHICVEREIHINLDGYT